MNPQHEWLVSVFKHPITLIPNIDDYMV